MANRITPVLNLIANGNYCAYKGNISTTYALPLKRPVIKNGVKGLIAFCPPKAFGRISRCKLWQALYGKGLLLRASMACGVLSDSGRYFPAGRFFARRIKAAKLRREKHEPPINITPFRHITH